MIPTIFDSNVFERISCSVVTGFPILLCTDYDGTLVPFSATPSETKTPRLILGVLQQLANLPQVEVAIVSGRSLADLEKLVPLEGLSLVGLHGVDIRFSNGEKFLWPDVEAVLPTLQQIGEDLSKFSRCYPGVLVENKRYAVTLHYRQYSGSEQRIKDDFYELMEQKEIVDLSGLEILEGAKLIELRPKGPDKGNAVEIVREQLSRTPELTIYIGDDATDEDAFRTLTDSSCDYPIVVSRDEYIDSNARYRLEDPVQVHRFLKQVLRSTY